MFNGDSASILSAPTMRCTAAWFVLVSSTITSGGSRAVVIAPGNAADALGAVIVVMATRAATDALRAVVGVTSTVAPASIREIISCCERTARGGGCGDNVGKSHRERGIKRSGGAPNAIKLPVSKRVEFSAGKRAEWGNGTYQGLRGPGMCRLSGAGWHHVPERLAFVLEGGLGCHGCVWDRVGCVVGRL